MTLDAALEALVEEALAPDQRREAEARRKKAAA
jgi:hypothetical protein